MPAATQDKLTRWVDDHVDALVKDFASEDDTIVLSAGADDTGDGDGEGGRDDSGSASGANEGDEEGTPS